MAVPALAIGVTAAIWLTGDAEDGTADAGSTTPETATTTSSPRPSAGDLADLGPERTGGVPVPTAPPTEVATDPREGPVDTLENSSAPARVSAEVFLTFAGWDEAASVMEAGGYVVGPLGDAGTCTLTLKGNGEVRSSSGDAISNATTVSCGTLRIDGATLGAGTWEAVLSFESDRASGASAPIKVQIP